MIDTDSLDAALHEIGLGAWTTALSPLIDARMDDRAHGRLAEWRDAVASLPEPNAGGIDRQHVTEHLLKLSPWRKGPLEVCGIPIDAEWRSDLKWARLADRIAPLAGRHVLDVGCGNGYYALKMVEAGAATVIGVDPSVLFVAQFAAIRKWIGPTPVHILPLRLEELPGESRAFDTTFSMGVLYHRRDPAQHLEELLGTLKHGGQLVLETLILPGEGEDVLVPADRYARMRNVWHLPTVARLERWLQDAGYVEPVVIDISRTTVTEQRTTAWMPFESLAEALDPADPARTIEGLPAPTRAIVLARAP